MTQPGLFDQHWTENYRVGDKVTTAFQDAIGIWGEVTRVEHGFPHRPMSAFIEVTYHDHPLWLTYTTRYHSDHGLIPGGGSATTPTEPSIGDNTGPAPAVVPAAGPDLTPTGSIHSSMTQLATRDSELVMTPPTGAGRAEEPGRGQHTETRSAPAPLVPAGGNDQEPQGGAR